MRANVGCLLYVLTAAEQMQLKFNKFSQNLLNFSCSCSAAAYKLYVSPKYGTLGYSSVSYAYTLACDERVAFSLDNT